MLLATAATMAFGGNAVPVAYFRLTDPDTIVIGWSSGQLSVDRVDVAQTEVAITITVTVVSLPMPQTAVGIPAERTIDLEEPLGHRQVLSGATGEPVLQTRCLPPRFAAPDCVIEPPSAD